MRLGLTDLIGGGRSGVILGERDLVLEFLRDEFGRHAKAGLRVVRIVCDADKTTQCANPLVQRDNMIRTAVNITPA